MYEQLQQTRQTSNARFRDLVEGFIQGILIHRDFTPLYANQALATLFGYPGPEAVLHLDTILRLFAPREQARMQQYNKGRLRGEPVPTHYEVQGVRQDGAIIWLEKTTRIVEWDGAPAVQATLMDITARKQAEAALETRMGRLRMLMRLNQLVSSGLEVDGVLREIACAAATLTGARVASCWIADDTTRTLELRAFSNERLRAYHPLERRKFGQGGVGWVAAQCRPLNVPDVFADGRLAFLDWWRAHGLRSLVALPILFEGALLGVLTVNGQDPFQFEPEDQELLDSFVAQAAVAIRNVRLYRDSEDHRQRLATLVDVTPRLTRGLDLPTVLQAIAEAAAQVFEGEAGFRLLQGDELVRAAATPGTRKAMVRERLRIGESLSGTVAATRQPFMTSDVAADPRLLPEHREVLHEARAGALLCVPVMAGERLLGTLNVNREPGYHFGPEGLRLAMSLADQAAIAIDNARLYGEALAQTERLEALTRTSAKVASTLQLNDLLCSIAEEAAHLLRIEGAGFRLLDGDRLVVGGTYGIARHVVRRPSIRVGESLTGWVAQQGRPLAVPDLRVDPLPLPEHRNAAQKYGVAGYLGVPLRCRDKLIGVLNVYARERRLFQENEIRLLSAFADQAAVAIERQRAHEALRDSEARYRELFENANDVVCTLDLTGHFTSLNMAAQRIMGYTRDEAIQMNLLQVVAPEYSEQARRLLVSEVAGTPSTTCELEVLTKAGKRVGLEVSTQPIFQNGTPVGVQAIARDITERKRLEEQLRQAQKMEAIGTLAGGIAHDFNNMLTIILGYTELALGDVSQGSRMALNLQEVLTAGQRAKSLVQQILTFSRQKEAEHRSFQLHVLVKEALKLLRASLPATITMHQHLATSSDTILADPTQMHLALMNLCTNAEHAMRASGGELEVRLDPIDIDAAFAALHPPLQPGAHVRLALRDTGHGMTSEVMDRIFEPFFTTKEVGEGTGMGLAMVHGIITSHGGAITVESARGQGTTFAIYLPRLIEPVADTAHAAETPLPLGTERILFVDDEAPLAHLGQGLLERLGYHMVVHTSSVEALEDFRTAPERFDLVITDQTMPDLTGEALTYELRRVRPDIPIILCTGFSHTMTEEKARALGIDAFLMKPLLARDLALSIRQVLAQRQP